MWWRVEDATYTLNPKHPNAMADALHFTCTTKTNNEKLACLAQLVTQTALACLGPQTCVGDGKVCRVPVVVVVNSRDALDACTNAVLQALPNALIARLHADQRVEDREKTLQGYRFAKNFNTDPATSAIQNTNPAGWRDGHDGCGLVLLATTAECLPSVATGEAPLGAALVIQMDVPRRHSNHAAPEKEAEKINDACAAYKRRVRAAIGDGHRRRPFVTIIASDEVGDYETCTTGMETQGEVPFGLQDIVVGGWRARKSESAT